LEGRPLDERARLRLARVLADDRPEDARWMQRIREWGLLERREPFSTALELLFHLRLDEAEAVRTVDAVLGHRRRLAARLGRDPGIRVAGIDYLTNVEPRISSPVVVDEEDWVRTLRSARSDPLTGLNNREVFHASLVREIRRGTRFGSEFALLLLDLDGFKNVNDRFGHLFGDLVLETVGSLLRRSTRETDVACRYGGEEFGIVLPQTDRLGAFEVGERVRVLVETRFATEDVDGIRVPLTLSAGIATFPEDGSTATEIVSRADLALYDAKASGRNRVRLRHPERRRAVRYPARRERRVLLEVAGSAARRAVPLDVSRHGMLVECDAEDPMTGAVELLIGEGDDRQGERPHVIRGEVVRADRVGARARLGLSFDAPLPDSLTSDLAAPRRRGNAHRGAA
jgi:diguanylate cyclase (GGDEF)-like protein